MRKIATVLVLASLVLVVGCGDKTGVWRPAGSPEFINLEGKKILIMPADMRYLPGDKLALSAALFGGFLAEFGAAGISLQPIQPALEQIGLGDLSWMLARGMVHAAFFHNSVAWDACGGEDYSVIPKLVKTLVEKVGELLGIPDLKFDYIAILHIDSLGSPIPKMQKMRVIGGLYDPIKDEIAVAIDWTQTTAEDAMLAEMALVGPKAVKIMQGEDPAKKEEKKE